MNVHQIRTSALVRHLPASPCPICRGHAGLPQGRGVRCAGFTLGRVVYCTREQFAGRLDLDSNTDPPSNKHRLVGHCGCGVTHGSVSGADASPAPDQPTRRPAPLPIQGEVYARAIELLDLRAEALDDLTSRGLTVEQAREFGYRSVPRRGREHRTFLAALVEEFGEPVLRQCPGFTDKNGRLGFWTASPGRDGYVVPYRGADGILTGFQMKVLGGRYLTAAGTHLETVYHLTGNCSGADLYVTEGATKANVAHALGGIAVFAVAGQSLKLSHVEVIRKLSPRRVVVAPDEEDNPRTEQARERWLRSLKEAGLPTFRAVWEGTDVGGPKGIDDLLLVGRGPRLRAVSFPPAELGERRRPYAIDLPGVVDRGVSLAQARVETARGIDAFVADATANAGKSRLVASSPGAGKSTALADAISEHRVAARVLVGTRQLAEEQAATHGYAMISGRDPDNCERHEVVRRLGETGHDVERLACGSVAEPRCPLRSSCAYWAQFRQPGPRVGATEQLFNPHFLAGGSLLALDDAEMLRSLVERSRISGEVLARAVQQLMRRRREPLRRLIVLLQHAVADAPERPLMGAAVWDHLAKTAARYSLDLGTLLRALPARATLPEPEADTDGYVTVEALDAAPPPTILRAVEALRAELPAFESGADFNSRLRIGSGGIDVWAPREAVADRHGIPIAPQMALLLLDATPVESLVSHVMRDHERLPDLRVTIGLPESVTVAQYAATSNGHSVLSDERNLHAAVAEVQQERTAHPATDPREEAVVVFRRHRTPFVDVGFAESQVVSFGSLRGTNALEAVERLHVVGRPMPPGDDLVFLAQALHHDEPPVSPQIVLGPRAYGGQPVGIDVVDFADPRVAALLRATRDDELVQVVHRARLLTLQPQLSLEPGEARQRVRVVLHTSHVVPGLRVDELHFAETTPGLNEQRADEAAVRIRAALASLIARGELLTVSSVARAAGAERRTVAKVLGRGVQTLKGDAVHAPEYDGGHGLGTPVQTVRSDLNKGVHTLPKSVGAKPGSGSPTRRRAATGCPPPGVDRCRGGCGRSVPAGQKCVECATAAVEAWVSAVRARAPSVAASSARSTPYQK